LPGERLDLRAIADPPIDADEHLDASRERLREDRPQRLRERVANDGDHHDGRVERWLKVLAHRVCLN